MERERSTQIGVWRLQAIASVLLMVGSAGCNNTTPADPTDGTPIETYVTRDLETQTWAPADELPSTQSNTIREFLASRGLKILVPLPNDSIDASATIARLSTVTYQPDEITSVTLRVETSEKGLSLQASDKATVPTCEDRLDGDSLAGVDASWVMSEMRGHQACLALVKDGISFLEWDEAGVRFSLSWDGYTIEDIQSWLSQWKPLP